MKIVVTFIKGNTPYAKGDITRLEEEDAKELERKGLVQIGLVEEAQPVATEPEPIKDKNIKGEKYKKGKIDVVIPTTDAKEVKKKSKKTKK
jgi:hypothetical protein